ncbi:MAG: NAD(P)-dependent oxidoreductase, partial [Kiritimatiellae bacterium]|nr:NAD(P)-dependent oxidoreductase [Kiritimatiellia bacterium]
MRVLVTGAAGFAGGYLVRELLAAGHEPVATDAAAPDSPAAAALPRYSRVDLRDA